MNMEKEKRNFENHKATLTDYGNIIILDFKNPESIETDAPKETIEEQLRLNCKKRRIW